MYFAIHMTNRKTGEKRIQKVEANNVDEATSNDFFYKSEWSWNGTEPWHNVEGRVVHTWRNYYHYKEENT